MRHEAPLLSAHPADVLYGDASDSPLSPRHAEALTRYRHLRLRLRAMAMSGIHLPCAETCALRARLSKPDEHRICLADIRDRELIAGAIEASIGVSVSMRQFFLD